jgi:hypothetical protein
MANDDVIGKIVKALYDAKASKWPIKDKAALLAAVQLSLQPEPFNEPEPEAEVDAQA